MSIKSEDSFYYLHSGGYKLVLSVQLLYLIIVSGYSQDSFQQDKIVIDASIDQLSIDLNALSILKDTMGQDIWSIKGQVFFSPNHYPRPSMRRYGSIYWTKLILDSRLDQNMEMWLHVDANLSYGYAIHESGDISQSQTGIMMPHNLKTIRNPRHRRANYIPFTLRSGEELVLIIRSQYPGNPTDIVEINRIESPQQAETHYLERYNKLNFWNGAFQALLIIIILYCLFYSIYSREAYAIYLTLYSFINSIYFLLSDGYLYYLDWIANSPDLLNIAFLNLVNVSIVFELVFIKKYLPFKNWKPVWGILIRLVISSGILSIFSIILLYFSTDNYASCLSITSLFQLVYILFRISFLPKVWQAREPGNRIFAIAWTVGFLISIVAWSSYYLFPNIPGLLLLKLAVGAYLSIIVISLGYTAAKTRNEKLAFKLKTDELQRLDQLKTNFFANVAHELRTPLTLILSPLQSILKSKHQLGDQNYSYIDLAEKNGQRLLQLVNEILDLNKLESGKLELITSTITIYDFIKRIVSGFQSYAHDVGVELTFEYNIDRYLQVKLDDAKAEVILNNLLSNALKFTPKGGQVSLKATTYRQYLEISISDTGRGIDEQHLPYIFDRYYQTRQSDSTVEGGTGIGLALSSEFAKLMGGKMTVHSTLSKGSIFTLSVPIVEVIAHTSSDHAEEPNTKTDVQLNIGTRQTVNTAESNPHKNYDGINQSHILIVEDNADLRRYITSILSKKYDLSTAENGQAALGYIMNCGESLNGASQLPQLVITDIMMPVMDGYQLIAALKSSIMYRSIPIIAITALASADDKLKALRIGVDDYMLKPFSEDELLARIDNLLQHAIWRAQALSKVPHQVMSPADGVPTDLAPEVELQVSAEDHEWLEKLEEEVRIGISNYDFNVEHLGKVMATSRWQLNRRLKSLTGLTTSQYVLEMRLNQARTFLESGKCRSLKALAYEIGIKEISHFSRQFKVRFGKMPSAYF